jgi:hypothetical protein
MGENKLLRKKEKIYVFMVGIFYLISGIWEYLLGLTQLESTPPGVYFLLDLYRKYAVNLGLITIFAGIAFLLLFRFHIFRLIVLILTWWNLFTTPLIVVWWNIYAISIKRLLITYSWFALWVYSIIIISVLTFIRIYIINIVKNLENRIVTN